MRARLWVVEAWSVVRLLPVRMVGCVLARAVCGAGLSAFIVSCWLRNMHPCDRRSGTRCVRARTLRAVEVLPAVRLLPVRMAGCVLVRTVCGAGLCGARSTFIALRGPCNVRP